MKIFSTVLLLLLARRDTVRPDADYQSSIRDWADLPHYHPRCDEA